MSDTPSSGPSAGPSPPGPAGPPTPAPPWPPPPPTAPPRAGRRLPFFTLAIALVALGVGIGAWLRPVANTSPAASAPTYTDEEIATAKANVCEAYSVVDRSVVMNTRRINPVPGDEIGTLATQVYGELALYQGGDYLLDRLSAEPATSADLAKPIKSLGDTLKKFGMIVLAGEPESDRDPLRRAVDTDSATIEGLCK